MPFEVAAVFFAQFPPASLDMQGETNMGTLNKVMLIGRLGRDPDERSTANGTRVSNFSVATDTFRGNGVDKITEWHRIVVFGKIAEVCNQYLRKGQLVFIEGSLQTRSWEKPPGEKHYMTEVVGSRITFLERKNGESHATVAAGEESGEPF
jgi:single-strand DNA-binding protein